MCISRSKWGTGELGLLSLRRIKLDGDVGDTETLVNLRTNSLGGES